MIIGIGSDMVDIRRIEKVLDRFGDRFLRRVFTEAEQERAEARQDRAASYAKRFAAKEACAKALGTGIRDGVEWVDFGVVNMANGRPALTLTGKAMEILANLVPVGMVAQIDVTLADEHPIAHAMVVISALPQQRV